MLIFSSKVLRNCSSHLKPWNATRKMLNTNNNQVIYRHSVCLCSSSQHTDIEPLSGLPFVDKNKGRLIYSGPLAKMIKGVKIFSLSTSLIGLSLQPLILRDTQTVALVAKLAVGGIVNFFIFVTPLIIHFISKKYVSVCYYDQVTGYFTATTYTFFLRKREHRFTADDVHVPEVPGIFTTIKVKGIPLFMDQSMFFSKDAYIRLMGYDKPLDWMPTETQVNNNNNSETVASDNNNKKS